jgi:hypothetical protein
MLSKVLYHCILGQEGKQQLYYLQMKQTFLTALILTKIGFHFFSLLSHNLKFTL